MKIVLIVKFMTQRIQAVSKARGGEQHLCPKRKAALKYFHVFQFFVAIL